MFIEYKSGEKHAGKGADTSPFHEPFQDAGYLLEKDDLVVDIDHLSKETIEAMIKTFDIKTQIVHTTRGIHMYFKKPSGFKGKKEAICPLGFKVEYLTIKNRPNGVTIKRDGVLRTIDNLGIRQELPDFLYFNKQFDDLNGLSDGDGRDNKLYNHKFKVMPIKNYKKILRFINEHVFAEPFSEDDFQRIARDEELLKVDKGNEGDIAKHLIHKLKVKKFCNVLFLYDGVRYKADEDFITIVNNEIPEASTRFIDEVVKKMKYSLFNEQERVGGWDVKFKNGFIRKGKFYEVDTDEFTPFYIDVDYNPEAEPVQTVDDYLNHLSKGHDGQEPEENYKKFILELIGHSLITDINFKRNKNFQRVVFFTGDGGNGKGTLFAVIRAILGSGNYSTTKLGQIIDERYIYTMKGKLVNLGDDIEDKPIDTKIMNVLKNLSGFDEIQFRKLYGMPVDESITTTQMFTSNHVLKSFEKGNSWKRRVIWAPMYVKPEKYDPRFMEKLLSSEALEYWVKLVIEAYMDLYKKGDFTQSQKVKEFTEKYHQDNNGCLLWVRDREAEHFIGKTAPMVYEEYEVWALEQDGKAQSPKTLKTTIENEFGLEIKTKKVNGKTARVYQMK
ncbi:DUF5906 domain-containing protein [Neobacillus sp. 179-C4.2 HS]|uniref:DUF5906 domain-containing protein n=1 Tax=Neobacillus driksii TaxID=3035913 RepID=A0ABV4YUD6_9BACI|nr:DUF5906 domain-containing protein [Neobacillus sp. 179.-C4.2 HS]MDP5192770.1 DUF5906 domain-containing protein [Neobacillus sp. 179.-C4.2 HS]